MKYVYFVSYAHSNGFGSCQITQKKEISSINEVDAIALLIEEDKPGINVCVLFFTLLRTEPC